MALFKNEIPILEFDTEQIAVIMPGHHSDYSFPHKGVMLFMESEKTDSLANVDAHDMRNWGDDFFAAAMSIAMEAITEV